MSRDLKNFVLERNGAQSQQSLSVSKHFENRRALAEVAKVKPRISLGQTQAVPQYRPVSTTSLIPNRPASVQSQQHHSGEPDAFAETTLGDDSDDTSIRSVRGDNQGVLNLKYELSQRNYKTEESSDDDPVDGEGCEEEIAGILNYGEGGWDRQATGNIFSQADRLRFQTSPDKKQALMLSVSQRALFQNLRQQDPRIDQILIGRDEKEKLHNILNQHELQIYAQSRKSGRFENNVDKPYSGHQQIQAGQNGMNDGRAIHPQRHNMQITSKEPHKVGDMSINQTIDGDIGEDLEPLSPGQALLQGNQAEFPVADAFAESSYGSSSRESSPSERTPKVRRQTPSSATVIPEPASTKRTAVELDYDQNTLFNIEYATLKEQAFDSNPKPTVSVVPDHLVGPNFLNDRLQHFASLGPDIQTQFFAQMPKDEWDKSGDWFVGRFTDILSKLKDARQAKREISKAFEDELATREEALRDRGGEIDETLRAMKQGGESVLKGSVI